MSDEREILQRAFAEHHIHLIHQASIMGYLNMLRTRDPESYHHSVRVGLLASKIAAECGIARISPKALFWAGSLHDIGKILVSPALFQKGIVFTDAEYREMEPHVEYGWRILRAIHDYTAHIIVRHHRYGARPYPARLPSLPAHLISKQEIIDVSGRLLALADYYDALMHRKNKKFGGDLTLSQKRAKYFEENADQKELILHLEKQGILSFSH
jgi:putative nucleotidyltransferase with HDIG domain